MFQADRERLVRWSALVADAARPGTRLIDALRHPSVAEDRELSLAAHLACFTFDGAHLPAARDHAVATGNAGVVAEIDRLDRLYAPTAFVEPSRGHVEDTILDFAAENGIEILRVLQEGSDGEDARQWVFLGVGPDGIVKVWKEIDERAFDAARWRQALPSEDELFLRAGNVDGLSRFHGTENLDGVRFLRRAYVYGQSLLDFVRDGRRLGETEARQFVGDLARSLASLHARGVVIGDLRPQNIRVGTDGRPTLFDLGLGYALGDDPLADHDAFVTDARYLAPEMVWQHRLGRRTEVFQLGMLYHQLRYGKTAFGNTAFPENRESHEALAITYGLPSALLAYEGDDPLLRRMLDPDPAARPSMAEVAAALTPSVRVFVPHPPRKEAPVKRPRDTVLVPARIGLPHRGHVDLIARYIDLGYRALVSLQQAYTITDSDPYPKWDVMKMVARSLIRLGYRPDVDFAFTFTRLFETDREHEMHFSMLPEVERVAAIGSGNPSTAHLLARPMFDQKMVFGEEGEAYETRSWGEILRRAVREGDRGTFDALAACGVEGIMSFDELREAYARTPVEFVPAFERFVLAHADGHELASGRIRRYGTPDQHVVARLNASGHVATILDPFARHTEVAIGGETGTFRYEDGKLQPDHTLLIRVTFVPHGHSRP